MGLQVLDIIDRNTKQMAEISRQLAMNTARTRQHLAEIKNENISEKYLGRKVAERTDGAKNTVVTTENIQIMGAGWFSNHKPVVETMFSQFRAFERDLKNVSIQASPESVMDIYMHINDLQAQWLRAIKAADWVAAMGLAIRIRALFDMAIDKMTDDAGVQCLVQKDWNW